MIKSEVDKPRLLRFTHAPARAMPAVPLPGRAPARAVPLPETKEDFNKKVIKLGEVESENIKGQ